jgi:hypothetical protein
MNTRGGPDSHGRRPDGQETTMSGGYEDEYEDRDEPQPRHREDEAPAAAPGLTAPGVLMIITGLVNLACAAGAILMGVTFQHMPREEFEKAYQQQNPAQRKQLEDAGWTTDDLLNVYVRGGYGGGVAWIVGGLLTTIGGICMLARKARGLAIVSAIVTAVPCALSPCCLFGMPIGIWALIVLFQPDAKAAFR